jgi:hypothetical protein
LKQHAADL